METDQEFYTNSKISNFTFSKINPIRKHQDSEQNALFHNSI